MRKRVLVTLVLAIGILGGIGNQTNAGTLSCFVPGFPRVPEGEIPGISPSTAPTLFGELCNSHFSSCDRSCDGRLE